MTRKFKTSIMYHIKKTLNLLRILVNKCRCNQMTVINGTIDKNFTTLTLFATTVVRTVAVGAISVPVKRINIYIALIDLLWCGRKVKKITVVDLSDQSKLGTLLLIINYLIIVSVLATGIGISHTHRCLIAWN